MANKRMFSRDMLCSDGFLDLDIEARMLYIYLNMEADDDGFLNNAKSVCRTIGVPANNLDVLVDAGLLFQFGKIYLIVHWNMNNSIRKDRKKDTQFTDCLQMVTLEKNGIYRLAEPDGIPSTVCQPNDNQMTTKCQPTANQMPTQYSIDKNSIGEVSIDEYRAIAEQVVQAFNCICTRLQKNRLTTWQVKEIARLYESGFDLEQFEIAFQKVNRSEFLTQKVNFSVTLNWLLKGEHLFDVVNGKYDNTKKDSNNLDWIDKVTGGNT